jgi:hypothetical protein
MTRRRPRALFRTLGLAAAIAMFAPACQDDAGDATLIVGLRSQGQAIDRILTIEVVVEESIAAAPRSDTVTFVAPTGTRWTILPDQERTLALTFADSPGALSLEVTVLGDLGKLATGTAEVPHLQAAESASVSVALAPVGGP